jgi:hypothetical protein
MTPGSKPWRRPIAVRIAPASEGGGAIDANTALPLWMYVATC